MSDSDRIDQVFDRKPHFRELVPELYFPFGQLMHR